MVRKAMIERLTKLGEQTVNQAAEVLGKNKTLQDKLETVVKGGMAVKDEVEGNVKVVIDRLNLKNAVDLDGIKERLDSLESDIENLLGELSGRVASLTSRVGDLHSKLTGNALNDETIEAVEVVETPIAAAAPAAEASLAGLTVKALRELATERKIEVPTRILKVDLIALIEAA
jgi:tetrahydromethanopterin S-methyltransferase subunit G